MLLYKSGWIDSRILNPERVHLGIDEPRIARFEKDIKSVFAVKLLEFSAMVMVGEAHIMLLAICPDLIESLCEGLPGLLTVPAFFRDTGTYYIFVTDFKVEVYYLADISFELFKADMASGRFEAEVID